MEECERTILWRAIVHQTRKITIDGRISTRIELEPTTAITSLTRWTPTDPAEVVSEDTYDVVSRDPAGTIIAPSSGSAWPEPERDIGSFELTFECGFEVTDAVNSVPASILLMLNRAIAFRSGAGLADIQIGPLDFSVADSYKTDRLPAAIASVGQAWAFRPGLFIGRP